MTLSDLTDHVCDKLGKNDSITRSICKAFIKRRHQMIYDGQLWRESLIQYTVVADSDTVVLPWNIERVVAVRWSDRELPPIDQQTVFQIDPQAFDAVGTPVTFSTLGTVPTFIPASNEAASTLTMVSDDASDTGAVLIRSMLADDNNASGGPVPGSASVNLNGTTPVNILASIPDFDSFTSLTRASNTSKVTFSQNTGDGLLVIASIYPNETESRYLRIRLLQSPKDTTKSVLILGKAKFQAMNSDNDTPLIPRNIDNALIAFGLADMLDRQRQYDKAQLKVSEAGQLLDQAKRLETQEGAASARIIPWVDGQAYGMAFDEAGSWDVKNN